MKQHTISIWLKAIIIFTSIIGIVFTIGVLSLKLALFETTTAPALTRPYLFIYIMVLFYIMLFHFWKVCTEIGKENSFSLSNSKSFMHMAICTFAMSVGCLVKNIYNLQRYDLPGNTITGFPYMFIYTTLFFFCISLLCLCLSQLIRIAYEEKDELDRTI
ncbi:MAG: DUF2975 domain-containing protein [Agathobacter sp.]|nr:DUF2975 domain-containing protein [Agathobacter sp.]